MIIGTVYKSSVDRLLVATMTIRNCSICSSSVLRHNIPITILTLPCIISTIPLVTIVHFQLHHKEIKIREQNKYKYKQNRKIYCGGVLYGITSKFHFVVYAIMDALKIENFFITSKYRKHPKTSTTCIKIIGISTKLHVV